MQLIFYLDSITLYYKQVSAWPISRICIHLQSLLYNLLTMHVLISLIKLFNR